MTCGHEAELHRPCELAFPEGGGFIHRLQNKEQREHTGEQAIKERDNEADKRTDSAIKKLVLGDREMTREYQRCSSEPVTCEIKLRPYPTQQ